MHGQRPYTKMHAGEPQRVLPINKEEKEKKKHKV